MSGWSAQFAPRPTPPADAVELPYRLAPGADRALHRAMPSHGVKFIPGTAQAVVRLCASFELWDLRTGVRTARLSMPQRSVGGAWEITRGGVLVCAGDFGEIVSVQLDGTLRCTYKLSPAAQAYLCAEPTGLARFGGVSTSDGVYEDRSRLQPAYGIPCDLSAARDESTIAAAYGQTYATVWNALTGKLVCVIGEESQTPVPTRIYRVALSGNGRLALTADTRGDIRLWDVTTSREVRRWQLDHRAQRRRDTPDDMPSEVSSAAGIGPVSFAEGDTLVAAADGARIRTWHIGSGAETNALEGHAAVHPIFADYPGMPRIHGIRTSHDGRRALTVGVDCTLRVWDVLSGACLWDAEPAPCCVDFADISDNGNYVVWVGCPGATVYSLAHLR
jgi:WD40 repeat protein